MNIFGKNIKLSFIGESSSQNFSLIIDGIKPGIKVNIEKIRF